MLKVGGKPFLEASPDAKICRGQPVDQNMRIWQQIFTALSSKRFQFLALEHTSA